MAIAAALADHRDCYIVSALSRDYNRDSASSLYNTYNAVRFEWDAEKDRANRAKHHALDFESAARVFDDPNVVFLEDRFIDGEQRWHAIGSVLTALLLVVHVYSEDDKNGEEIIRIISAREASQRERRIYFQQGSD